MGTFFMKIIITLSKTKVTDVSEDIFLARYEYHNVENRKQSWVPI